jgi:HCOMODA/2-hydroxy-3-carboxy-muconic semialdehyde decarboxylase
MSGETTLETVLDDLVIANRILANEGVIDAFGHVSIRDPRRPDRYFLARSRSPELVERRDIRSSTWTTADRPARADHVRRPIHARRRRRAGAVCHNHARR